MIKKMIMLNKLMINQNYPKYKLIKFIIRPIKLVRI